MGGPLSKVDGDKGCLDAIHLAKFADFVHLLDIPGDNRDVEPLLGKCDAELLANAIGAPRDHGPRVRPVPVAEINFELRTYSPKGAEETFHDPKGSYILGSLYRFQ